MKLLKYPYYRVRLTIDNFIMLNKLIRETTDSRRRRYYQIERKHYIIRTAIYGVYVSAILFIALMVGITQGAGYAFIPIFFGAFGWAFLFMIMMVTIELADVGDYDYETLIKSFYELQLARMQALEAEPLAPERIKKFFNIQTKGPHIHHLQLAIADGSGYEKNDDIYNGDDKAYEYRERIYRLSETKWFMYNRLALMQRMLKRNRLEPQQGFFLMVLKHGKKAEGLLKARISLNDYEKMGKTGITVEEMSSYKDTPMSLLGELF